MAREVFKKPIPQEAMDYFNSKDLKIGFDYRDVWRMEHAYSFTVAKAMTTDILIDIQTALAAAIEEGKTFQQFQKELKPTLQKKGWWGEQFVGDSEGNIEHVRFVGIGYSGLRWCNGGWNQVRFDRIGMNSVVKFGKCTVQIPGKR